MLVDQAPIGRTPRSNPVTYLKAFDPIRELFAATKDARSRGLTASHFSFNVPGGRCEACEGEGEVKVEMQFLADVFVPCEHCEGKRFKPQVLEVKYRGRDIDQVLDMTVREALTFFSSSPKVLRRLQVLDEIGLGYLRLGQPATTLSGGEAQRIKIAAHLSSHTGDRVLYILDEPTTGLHFDDIAKLLAAFRKLLQAGHSLLVIEHNLDVIKTADWIIDLGPEGGEEGGQLVAAGTPEQIVKVEASHTGRYLRDVLAVGPRERLRHRARLARRRAVRSALPRAIREVLHAIAGICGSATVLDCAVTRRTMDRLPRIFHDPNDQRVAVCLSVLCGTASAQQARFDDVIRNLRNPDPKVRLSAVQAAARIEVPGSRSRRSRRWSPTRSTRSSSKPSPPSCRSSWSRTCRRRSGSGCSWRCGTPAQAAAASSWGRSRCGRAPVPPELVDGAAAGGRRRQPEGPGRGDLRPRHDRAAAARRRRRGAVDQGARSLRSRDPRRRRPASIGRLEVDDAPATR